MKTHTIPSSVSYVINFMTWDVSESLDLPEFHDGFRSGRWLPDFKSHGLITWPQFLSLHPHKPPSTHVPCITKIMGNKCA